MNNLTKNLIMWLVIAMVLMAVFNNFVPNSKTPERNIDYSTFIAEVEQGNVERVSIDGDRKSVV